METFPSCEWCGLAAVAHILLEPGRSARAGGDYKKPIRAWACKAHEALGLHDPEDEPEVPLASSLRRRKARDVEQLTIYDVPGVDPKGPHAR